MYFRRLSKVLRPHSPVLEFLQGQSLLLVRLLQKTGSFVSILATSRARSRASWCFWGGLHQIGETDPSG